MTVPHPPPRRRLWLVIGGLVTAVLLGLGALGAWWLLTGRGVQQTQHTTTTEAMAPETISVHGTGANVSLNGADVAEVTADIATAWYTSEPVVDTQQRAQQLVVDLYCRHRSIPVWFSPSCSIEYTAQVPSSAGATVELDSGKVAIENLAGELTLRTVAGDISVTDGPQTLDARSSSGQIDLEFSTPHQSYRSSIGGREYHGPSAARRNLPGAHQQHHRHSVCCSRHRHGIGNPH